VDLVTHHVIKVLEDGTRVYSNYTRYKPKPPSERKYAVRKPPVEGAVRWGGLWLLPLPLLPMHQRLWPETRPDTDAYEHMSKPRKCMCLVCRRPEAQRWKDQWRKDQTLTAGS
jgi:hypothetical protein